MKCVAAKDIMHPRLSLPQKASGPEVVMKLLSEYPALPVVNDRLKVVGIVSEFDVLDAIKEGRTVHEFSAESIMSCGHIEHASACTEPVTVSPDTTIDDIVELFYGLRISVIPVVDGRKLVGIVSRKCVMNAMAERGFWPEHELTQRVKVGASA